MIHLRRKSYRGDSGTKQTAMQISIGRKQGLNSINLQPRLYTLSQHISRVIFSEESYATVSLKKFSKCTSVHNYVRRKLNIQFYRTR